MSLLKLPLFLGLLLPLAVLADSVSGPDIRFETSGTGRVASDADDGASRVSHSRIHANLFLPLTVKSWDVLFIPRVDLFLEQRRYEESSGTLSELSPSLSSLSTLALGTAALKPFGRNDEHTGFVTFTRFGSPDFSSRARGMYESYIGAKMRDVFPVISGTRSDELLLLFRLRHFPNGFRYLPFVGKKFTFPSGWYFDLLIPAHALAGWQSADETWRLTGGFRFNARDYAFEGATYAGWVEGNTQELFLSVKRRLHGVFHLLVEGGLQAERFIVHTATQNLGAYSTAFSPWLGFSLQTLFPNETP